MPNRPKTSFAAWAALVLIIAFAVYFKLAIFPWLIESGPRDKALASQLYLRGVAEKIEQFRLDCGRLPWGLDEFFSLAEDSDIAGRWHGPYCDRQPVDAWGYDIQYRYPALRSPDGYDLWSVGPDGQDKTDDDIGYEN